MGCETIESVYSLHAATQSIEQTVSPLPSNPHPSNPPPPLLNYFNLNKLPTFQQQKKLRLNCQSCSNYPF